jgi:hypothetical protein
MAGNPTAETRTATRRAIDNALLLFAGLWIVATVAFLGWQKWYMITAGEAAVAPMRWPAAGGLGLRRGRFNLLVFVHPQCPCSRATLAELARIAAVGGSQLDTRVLVLQYAGQADSKTSPMYQQARTIAEVSVSVDTNGAAARAFGAVCSGQALLYAPRGRLLFSGGITGLRGHEGDNAGETAILRLLDAPDGAPGDPPAAVLLTPVFGCSLLDGELRWDRTVPLPTLKLLPAPPQQSKPPQAALEKERPWAG